MPTKRKTTPIEDEQESVLVRITPGLFSEIQEAYLRIKRDKDVKREGMRFTKLALYAKLEKHVDAVVDECLSVARRRKLMKRKRKPKAAPVASEIQEMER